MAFSWGPDPVMAWVIAAGLEPGEVLYALSTDPRWPRPARDPVTGLHTVMFWSRTSSGRAITVVTRRVGERDWEIIGARPLTQAEEAELAEWEAERERR